MTRSHKHVLNQVEEPEEDEVEEIVGMGVEDLLEEQLEKAFEGCVWIPGMERPSKNKVKEALEVATKKASAGTFRLLRKLKFYGTTIFSLMWIYRPPRPHFLNRASSKVKHSGNTSHRTRMVFTMDDIESECPGVQQEGAELVSEPAHGI